jgi:hypothetical protein
MDNKLLAEQYAKTGNLMDLCSTEAWLQESAQIEDEGEGQIEAGLAMKDYQNQVKALTDEQSRQLRNQMRVQSTLFTGLYTWMNEWDLGAGFKATYTIARRLIRQHLADPAPPLQIFIDVLLAENSQTSSTDKPTQQQMIELLSEIFTPEDWQVMAQAASQSISSQVLNTGLAQPRTAAA